MEDINQQLSHYAPERQPVLTQAHSMHITHSSSVIPKTGFVKIAYSEEYLFIMAHCMQKTLWRFSCKPATEKATDLYILSEKLHLLFLYQAF